MTLRTHTLPHSLLYLGAGFNWEPLHRFSHLCDTFLYVSLFCSLDEVREALENDLRDNPFLELRGLRVDRGFDETTHFELHPDYRSHLTEAQKRLPQAAAREYSRVFSGAAKDPQWLLEADIRRKGTDRRLRLQYMTAEGMASYIALTHNGRYAPRILVTVQTGCLEKPNGFMTDILEHCEKKPEIWVRGFEPDYRDRRNPTLSARDRIYPVPGGDFLFRWEPLGVYVGFGEKNGHGSRHCRAFITEQMQTHLQGLPLPDYARNGILPSGWESLPPAPSGQNHLVVTTDAISRRLAFHPSYSVRRWDSLMPNNGRPCSMRDSLERLRTLDASGAYEAIHFTPLGMEDEGIHLDAFLRETHRARMQAVVHRPLDLLDLRVPAGTSGTKRIFRHMPSPAA
jgi:hypothetical protein